LLKTSGHCTTHFPFWEITSGAMSPSSASARANWSFTPRALSPRQMWRPFPPWADPVTWWKLTVSTTLLPKKAAPRSQPFPNRKGQKSFPKGGALPRSGSPPVGWGPPPLPKRVSPPWQGSLSPSARAVQAPVGELISRGLALRSRPRNAIVPLRSQTQTFRAAQAK
jgi:hypothetical protein